MSKIIKVLMALSVSLTILLLASCQATTPLVTQSNLNQPKDNYISLASSMAAGNSFTEAVESVIASEQVLEFSQISELKNAVIISQEIVLWEYDSRKDLGGTVIDEVNEINTYIPWETMCLHCYFPTIWTIKTTLTVNENTYVIYADLPDTPYFYKDGVPFFLPVFDAYADDCDYNEQDFISQYSDTSVVFCVMSDSENESDVYNENHFVHIIEAQKDSIHNDHITE